MFVAPQINAQDIDYQEQLGHGNGGTVYKWVFTGTNITRPQHNNGYWPYIYYTLQILRTNVSISRKFQTDVLYNSWLFIFILLIPYGTRITQ